MWWLASVSRAMRLCIAITKVNYDGVRVSSGAFRSSAEISLCRRKVYPLKKIVSIFHRDVKDPVVLIVELTVDFIEDAGAKYTKGPDKKPIPAPFPLTVVTDPERCNKSHAVIPEVSIPERLSKHLGNSGIKHNPGVRAWHHVAQRRIHDLVNRAIDSFQRYHGA